jgi:hypothetical protein
MPDDAFLVLFGFASMVIVTGAVERHIAAVLRLAVVTELVSATWASNKNTCHRSRHKLTAPRSIGPPEYMGAPRRQKYQLGREPPGPESTWDGQQGIG